MKSVFVFFIVCAAAVRTQQVKNTRQCKAGGGICKEMCAVDEEDTGSCCRHSYRCCQTPTCNDTLKNGECEGRNGVSKPVCDVNEQDTGIGPLCNDNRCCEPPACIAKPCCSTCGGIFNGPVGRFTSPNYPADYCDDQNCYYRITVAEDSKVMLTFTYFFTEDIVDFVEVFDGEVNNGGSLGVLTGGPFEGIVYNSTSNKIIVHFVSDYRDTRFGFTASYKVLQ